MESNLTLILNGATSFFSEDDSLLPDLYEIDLKKYNWVKEIFSTKIDAEKVMKNTLPREPPFKDEEEQKKFSEHVLYRIMAENLTVENIVNFDGRTIEELIFSDAHFDHSYLVGTELIRMGEGLNFCHGYDKDALGEETTSRFARGGYFLRAVGIAYKIIKDAGYYLDVSRIGSNDMREKYEDRLVSALKRDYVPKTMRNMLEIALGILKRYDEFAQCSSSKINDFTNRYFGVEL